MKMPPLASDAPKANPQSLSLKASNASLPANARQPEVNVTQATALKLDNSKPSPSGTTATAAAQNSTDARLSIPVVSPFSFAGNTDHNNPKQTSGRGSSVLAPPNINCGNILVSPRTGAISNSQRRRKTGGAYTLFVKQGMNNGAHEGKTLIDRRDTQSPLAPPTPREEDPLIAERLAETILAKLMKWTETITARLPALRRAIRKPLVTAAIVFVFFLLCNVLILVHTKSIIQTLLDVSVAQNDEQLTIASSLSASYLAMLTKATEIDPSDYVEMEKRIDDVYKLREMKDRSIRKLAKSVGYREAEDDIAFLVEQHVAYETHIQSLVQTELEWFYLAESARRARQESHQKTTHVIGAYADCLDGIANLADELAAKGAAPPPHCGSDNSTEWITTPPSEPSRAVPKGAYAAHVSGTVVDADGSRPVLEVSESGESGWRWTMGKRLFPRRLQENPDDGGLLLWRMLPSRFYACIAIMVLLYVYLHMLP